MTNLLTIIFILFLVGCTSSQKNSGYAITLHSISSLKVQQSDRHAARKLLGEPSKIVNIPRSTEETWLFLEGEYPSTRLSLTFDPTTGRLSSIGWFVRENDPEADLEISKQRFQDANFIQRDAEWVNPHAGPDEIYFLDDHLGVEIEFGHARQKVKSITWRPPGSGRNGQAPERQPTVSYDL